MAYRFEDWQSGARPPKGWDCADCVADGWSRQDIEAFMRATVRPWGASTPAVRPEPARAAEPPAGPAPADPEPEPAPTPAPMRDPDDAEPLANIPTGSSIPIDMHPKRDDIIALREWVFLSADNVFYHSRTSELMSRAAFDLAMARVTPSVEVEKSDGTTEFKKLPSSRTLVEYLGGRIVSHTMYAPQIGSQYFDLDGIPYLNAYLPRTVPKADPKWKEHDAWQICKHHIEYVFKENAHVLIQWMAHNVQFPGKKILWSPILIGIEGDGKTTVANMLKSAMGRVNVQEVSSEALFSDFNSWAEGACVRVMDEIRVPGERRTAAMNKLKPVITNDTVEVVRKGKDGKEIINVTNYIAMSNHIDALALTENDRRWAVMKTPFETKAERDAATGFDYWQKLIDAWRDHPGVIRGWLLNVDLSDFDRAFGPVMNDHKRAMIEASRSPAVADVLEAIELGGVGVSGDVLITTCLNEIIKDNGGRSLNTVALANILREIGWLRFEPTMKWRQKTRRVYYKPGVVPAGMDDHGMALHLRGLLDLTDEEGQGDRRFEDEELKW